MKRYQDRTVPNTIVVSVQKVLFIQYFYFVNGSTRYRVIRDTLRLSWREFIDYK